MHVRSNSILVCSISLLAVVACGCSAPPEQPYLRELVNRQYSFEDGRLQIAVDPRWEAWDQRNFADVTGILVRSPFGRCEGSAPVTDLDYQVVRSEAALDVLFSPGTIRCRFSRDEVAARFNLFPACRAFALFDPGEMKGQVSFVVQFKPIIR